MSQSQSPQLKFRPPTFFNGNGPCPSQGERKYIRIVFCKTTLNKPWMILSDLLTLAFLPFSVALVVSTIYLGRKRFRKQQRVKEEEQRAQEVRYWDI